MSGTRIGDARSPTCHRLKVIKMAPHLRFIRTPAAVAALAALAASQGASAQTTAEASAQRSSVLPPITVTGQSAASADVTGFGGNPLIRAPFSATVLTQGEMKDRGVERLADVTKFDAAVSDAYNAVGYWDFLTVRGFVLDNRFNFRRDGLPINAETSIPLDNKARVEVLKGTSGIQAGTSAPGGLVNYVVKRPVGEVRSASLGWQSANSRLAAADIGSRFGVDQAFGVRINAAYEDLDPELRSAKGHRHLFAMAADWRLTPDTLVEAEIETSRRSQPSQPGFSALGAVVPPPTDPRINLNNQPWSMPVVMDGNTASLRLQQRLSADWRFTAHWATQRLRTDDRLAYPFGCSKENNFDRYCSDGTFDFYSFRSDDEHRRTDALDLSAQGKFGSGALRHTLTSGVLFSRFTSRLNPRVDDGTVVGSGNVNGTAVIDPLPALRTVANTNRTERSTELYVRDAIRLGEQWNAWLGLRHTRLQRESVRTDGSRRTDYSQSITTPWLALGYEFLPRQMAYASWGEGIESEVAPNRRRYSNAGQALPALKSRQFELGLKGAAQAVDWQLAWFRIERPQSAAVGANCADDTTPGSCTQQIDGSALHQGLEAAAQWNAGPWSLSGSAMWLDAKRRGSSNPAVNGQRPPNVPERTLKLQTGYRIAAVPGLRLLGGLVHEGDRTLLPNNSSLRIPSWTRLDMGLVHQHVVDATTLTWRAGVENVTDKRAWRESPLQFEHIYLYPLAPRTFRVSLQADF
jgi:iron complex outermembrane receptor protein